MKKVISLVLSLVMIFTMIIASATSVFALEPTLWMRCYVKNSSYTYASETFYSYQGEFDFASKVSMFKSMAQSGGSELNRINVTDVIGDFSGNLPGDIGGVDFTIDLGGHTWTVTGNSTCSGNGSLTIKNGTLKFDMAGERPISVRNFNLENVNVIGNSSMDGLYSDEYGSAANINFKNCTVSNFYNDDYGMFYLYQDGGKFTCSNTTFDGNRSNNDGGVIFCDGCDIVIAGSGNSVMKNNYADDDGGAIYTSVASGCGNRVAINGFTFENNSADDDGGALDLGGSNNKVENCTFKGNASDDGYDIDFYGSGATMNNCKFLDHSEKVAIDGSYSGSGNSFASNGTGSFISNGSAFIILAVLVVALLAAFVVLQKKKKA